MAHPVTRATKGMLRGQAGRHSSAGRQSFELLRAHPMFGELLPGDLRRLSDFAAPESVRRGEIIFQKGDAGNSLYAIGKGSVKISVPGGTGREAMFNILGPKEIFGEVALLDGRPRTADAIALTACELYAINRRDFLALLNREPKLAVRIIELLCDRLRQASKHFEDFLFLNASGRLAKALLRLPYREGSASTRRIMITQQEISQMIGLSRESTNKQLRIWQDQGWLRIVRGGIVLLAPDAIAAVPPSAGTRA